MGGLAMGKLRIALTISGAVSVGAFEGGALAALFTGAEAVQREWQRRGEDAADPPIRIDAIGGASAGGMTAVMAAASLTLGLDAFDTMVKGWVTGPSLRTLRRHARGRAPLSMQRVVEIANEVLAQPQSSAGPAQRCAVHVRLAIANLRGLMYEIGRLALADHGRSGRHGSPPPPIQATTYADWADFAFVPPLTPDDFRLPQARSASDAARASGANEFGFPPQMLERSASEYQQAGVLLNNFPGWPEQTLAPYWFTDGGTLNNEPLGRVLDLTDEIDAMPPLPPEDTRLHLLIHPFPDPPPGHDAHWANPQRPPSWLRTFGRAYTLLRSQFLYSDLLAAEKTNSRKHWRMQLDEALDQLLVGDRLEQRWRGVLERAIQDPSVVDATLAGLRAADREVWGDALAPVLAHINEDRASLPRHGDLKRAAEPEEMLGLILDEITALADKHIVAIEVVTPQLVQGGEGHSTDQLLAGKLLLSFGGFLDEGLRWSDFALGYTATLNWMEYGLARCGLDTEWCDVALDGALAHFFTIPPYKQRGQTKGFTGYGLSDGLKVRAAALGLPFGPSWQPSDFAGTTLRTLSWGERWQLITLALYTAFAVVPGNLWGVFFGNDVP